MVAPQGSLSDFSLENFLLWAEPHHRTKSFMRIACVGTDVGWQTSEIPRRSLKDKWPHERGGDTLREGEHIARSSHKRHGGAFLNHLSHHEKLELLRSITAEHQSLKARVKQLEGQITRSPADQVEMAELKKKKLLMKDRIRVLECN